MSKKELQLKNEEVVYYENKIIKSTESLIKYLNGLNERIENLNRIIVECMKSIINRTHENEDMSIDIIFHRKRIEFFNIMLINQIKRSIEIKNTFIKYKNQKFYQPEIFFDGTAELFLYFDISNIFHNKYSKDTFNFLSDFFQTFNIGKDNYCFQKFKELKKEWFIDEIEIESFRKTIFSFK